MTRLLLTGLLFAATLVGVLRRPRGWHEAWWTCGAAALALALGLVRPSQALHVLEAGKDALLFLGALLLLATLLDHSGFFEWAAVACAHAAGGRGWPLFRNFLLLGALVTVTLSLDTTAVLLTPLVLVCAHRVGLPTHPFVVLSVLVSNVASLLLPVSNLTNLLLVDLTGHSFGRYVAVQLLPQAAVLGVLALALRLAYRRTIPARFDVRSLPAANTLVPDRPFFRASCIVLGAVLVGYFLASRLDIPVWTVAFAGVGVLVAVALARGVLRWGWFREVPVGIFPFVAGLFVLVRAVENLGLEAPAAAWLRGNHGTATLLAVSAGGTALASNVINNLPAALLARGILADAGAPPAAVYGAILGANVGPCITVHGSLATILVLAEARERGVEVREGELGGLALWLTPLLLLAGGSALWLLLA